MRCSMCGTQFVWDDNPPETPESEPEPEPLLSLADFAVLPATPEPEPAPAPEPTPAPAPEPVPLETELETEPEPLEPPIRYDYDIFAGVERRKLTAASRDFEAFTLLSALGCYEGEEIFLSVHPDPAVPPKATAVVFSPPKTFRVSIGEKPTLDLPTVRDEYSQQIPPVSLFAGSLGRMFASQGGARLHAICTQKKLFVGSTPESASEATTPGAHAVSGAPEGEAALVAEGVGVATEVEIPAVEPDWAETLSSEGPGMMMQKLCGFRLSHAEKTPDDPAERCVPNTPARMKCNTPTVSQNRCFEYLIYVSCTRIAMGAKSLTDLMMTLSKAGLRQGDATTQPHLEKYCGWVQTTYFDGITVLGASSWLFVSRLAPHPPVYVLCSCRCLVVQR